MPGQKHGSTPRGLLEQAVPDASGRSIQLDVWVWSDMLDPNHNTHGNYYLVQGDYTGSWNYVPKEMGIATWITSAVY